MHDLADLALLKAKMREADIFCDATGVGMHPLEDLSNIPDPSYFRKDLIVTDTVYAPRETVMMKQAKASGCERVYNGMSMMLFQALIAIRLYTGKSILLLQLRRAISSWVDLFDPANFEVALWDCFMYNTV